MTTIAQIADDYANYIKTCDELNLGLFDIDNCNDINILKDKLKLLQKYMYNVNYCIDANKCKQIVPLVEYDLKQFFLDDHLEESLNGITERCMRCIINKVFVTDNNLLPKPYFDNVASFMVYDTTTKRFYPRIALKEMDLNYIMYKYIFRKVCKLITGNASHEVIYLYEQLAKQFYKQCINDRVKLPSIGEYNQTNDLKAFIEKYCSEVKFQESSIGTLFVIIPIQYSMYDVKYKH